MSKILLQGLFTITRIHRGLFSIMSKLKISELISFIRRDKNAKCASSTLSSCSRVGMELGEQGSRARVVSVG